VDADLVTRDIADGLWIWRIRHPSWTRQSDWDPLITCTCVCSGGQTALIDALLPASRETELDERLAGGPPTMAVVLKPDHVRSVDEVVRRFRIPAYGPSLFWPDDVPESTIQPIEPGTRLPGGLEAVYDGRGRAETPLWLPEQRAIVFADALTAPGGVLRVWKTPWHEERTLPALRALLDLPFERVIVSHGEPVHNRAEYERALGRQAYG
jgi:hypothetical protein